MSEVHKISIQSEDDIVHCRRTCRELAKNERFGLVDQTRITTVASELARNIFEYAGEGEVQVEIVHNDFGTAGIKMIFKDYGPGITDVSKAMQDGWTSHSGMGLGLPGSKKLMDEFEIESTPGKGTTITTLKWQR